MATQTCVSVSARPCGSRPGSGCSSTLPSGVIRVAHARTTSVSAAISPSRRFRFEFTTMMKPTR
jgi:hypothetical protein